MSQILRRPITNAIQDATKESPAICTLVAANIYQVRLPLPFRLNHVNCYLLCDDAGWTVVDTGLNWPDAQAAWQVAFAELSIKPADIRQIVLTHMHPDHFGLAGWFQELCGQTVFLSSFEAKMVEAVWVNHAWRPDRVIDWWDSCGVPRAISQGAAEQAVHLRNRTMPHPQRMAAIAYGATVAMGGRTFRAIHAPGHSDGQIIFYDADDRLLLSGDQVLMKITPNVGLWPTTEPNPLGRYLTSLAELQSLDVQVALPGHRNVIMDWRGRIGEIIQHHNVRLQHMWEAARGGATAYEVSLAVFDFTRLSPHEIRFAVAETLAHLDYLVIQERLTQQTLMQEGKRMWQYTG